MNRFRLAAVAALAAPALLLWASLAHADQVYHSHHYDLTPINGAPLQSGFVENIHPNGPNVYAHENYVLNGATPDTSYQVVLSIWTSNLTCSGSPDLQIPTAVLGTNVSGNGKAEHVFTPADADGLHGHTVSLMWQVLAGGAPAYETGCEVVTLD